MKTAHIIPPPVPAEPVPAETDARGIAPAKTEAPAIGPGLPPAATVPAPAAPEEIGGPTGPEPTRYGDWEQKGRCSDF